MSTNIAISGLGRIGRCLIRALAEQEYPGLNLVAINGTGKLEQYINLLNYDSVHGRLDKKIRIEGDHLLVGRHNIKFVSQRDPALIPWKENNVDLVLECSGKFKSKKHAEQHISAGAKKVIISSPSEDADVTIVYGVNDDMLKPEHKVVSVGSCTTNALAPIAKVINDAFGIEVGYMTTIHAYTNDQTILDNRHEDPRRARACNLSMIPTSTGAAKALGLVLPELQGKLSGSAVRVPTPNVSMIDFAIILKNKASSEEVNDAIVRASQDKKYRGVIGVAEEKLVSIDFNHDPHSTIFDPHETHVKQNLARVVSWYDNEWGFSNRMLDVATLMK